MSRRSIPDPLIVLLQPEPAQPVAAVSISVETDGLTDARQLQVDQFLQSRAIAPVSRKAYQQDLQHFMDWTETNWREVTRRQIALFKANLIENRQLAPATVNRVLTTLKSFYQWMMDSQQIQRNPAIGIELLKLEAAEAKPLTEAEIFRVHQTVAAGKFPDRDQALVSLLLSGLSGRQVAALNIKDFDQTQLHLYAVKRGSQASIPLSDEAIAALNRYLGWRQQQGEALQPTSPLFLSYSHRSYGRRLSYWGIRDVIDAIKAATGIGI
jgi:integrase/recombinase XerD